MPTTDKPIWNTGLINNGKLEQVYELAVVRHGHWIERSKVYPDFPYDSTYNYECSNCGYMDTHGANVEVPYCWHCGARMDAPTQKSVGNALDEVRDDT